MFDVNDTTITLSRGDTGALLIKAEATRRDTGEPYIFGPRDRALFSIKDNRGAVMKQKIYPLVNVLLTVNAVARTGTDEPIRAWVADRAKFNAAVDQVSGTVELTYTSDWDEDPEDYGITVAGTPVDGDAISVAYRKNEFIVVFTNGDTDSLDGNSFTWDVRYVINPYYDGLNIVDGDQVITPKSPMSMGLINVVGEI